MAGSSAPQPPQPTPPSPSSTVVERRDEDGRLLATVGLDAAGALEGPFQAYDQAGRPEMRLMCRGGRPDGPATLYRDGRPAVEMTFVAGQLGQEMRCLDAAGRVVSIVRYAMGRRHGLMECLSPEGRPVLTADYRDDQLNGVWTEFRPDGSVARRVQYRDGLLDGETIEYDAAGQPSKRVLYAAGIAVESPEHSPEPATPEPEARPWWRRLFGG